MNLKAFTILEIIINLTLMGIIVGMVYVVYGYFSKNLSQYSLMTTENFELETFNLKMKEDFYKADRILFINEKEIKVVFYDETYVEYKQEALYIFRNNGTVKDSIKISGIEFTTLQSNLPENSEVLVKNVLVKAELFGNTAPLFAYKNYYSNYLNASE